MKTRLICVLFLVMLAHTTVLCADGISVTLSKGGRSEQPKWLEIDIARDSEDMILVVLRMQKRKLVGDYTLTLQTKSGQHKGMLVPVALTRFNYGFGASMRLPKELGTVSQLTLSELYNDSKGGSMYTIDIASYLEKKKDNVELKKPCPQSSAHVEGLKQSLPETEVGGREPWLQFRVKETDLGKIVVSRCEFVFPKDVEGAVSAHYVTKDGYLFMAKEMLYVTDRGGKLVVKHERPRTDFTHYFFRGDDWFCYFDNSPERPAQLFRLFHANGKEIGNVVVPEMCMPWVSRDASRVFFLKTTSPDGQRGPIVADVQTGKILKEHNFGFGHQRWRISPTKDGLVVQQRPSSGLIYIDSNGEIAWRSSLHLFGNSPTTGKYVLTSGPEDPRTVKARRDAGDGTVFQVLTVLDLKGQVVLQESFASSVYARLLPDEERLLVRCWENNQSVQQLFRLKDGRRLWSVPLKAGRPSNYDYACLSPDGTRLAIFTRYRPTTDRSVISTITVMDLAAGAELLHQELPFREDPAFLRQPRWTDAKTIEWIPGDYLYRIRLKF